MPLALVTGSRPHLGPTATALARTGFTVTTWETPSLQPPPSGPFDCYVQLPCSEARPPGPESVRCRRPTAPGDDLMRRVEALAAVATHLRPNASILLGVEDIDPVAGPRRGAPAPDLLAAVALALLEDLGRPAARVAVLSVRDLCWPAPAFTRIDPVVGATQWEMPTPPLVSAP
ncbi:MAG: hypothetical protein ACRDYF_19840 [Acidimicrobiia bacterium]